MSPGIKERVAHGPSDFSPNTISLFRTFLGMNIHGGFSSLKYHGTLWQGHEVDMSDKEKNLEISINFLDFWPIFSPSACPNWVSHIEILYIRLRYYYCQVNLRFYFLRYLSGVTEIVPSTDICQKHQKWHIKFRDTFLKKPARPRKSAIVGVRYLPCTIKISNKIGGQSSIFSRKKL